VMPGDTALIDGDIVFRKPMTFVMSSGVLVANPGSETGELLIGYPFSAVSTSQSTEQMTIKLRCYLGAGIYRPENVLILPHIAFEGLDAKDAAVTDESFERITNDELVAIFATSVTDGTPAWDATHLEADYDKAVEELCKPIIDMEEVAKALGKGDLASKGVNENLKKACEGGKFNPGHGFERKIYRGFSADSPSGENTLTTNTGHLGEVDSLEFCNRVWGTAGGQIYKPRVQTTKHITVKP